MRLAAETAGAFALAAVLTGGPVAAAETPSLIYTNATIWTGDPSLPWAEALWVDDGIIQGVGREDALAQKAGSRAKRLDLGGAFLCPGLVDAHAHVLGFGLGLTRVDLVGALTKEEALSRVALAAARDGEQAAEWMRGRGWDQNDWPEKTFPAKLDLDRVRKRPLALTRVDGHALWVNSAVLALAHITADTQDPPGGRIHRDARGEPTGILVDTAMDLVRAVMPPPTLEEKRRAILQATRAMAEAGLTGAHDMGMSVEEESLYREMAAQGEFRVRIYAALSADRALFTDAPDPAGNDLLRRLGQGPDRDWVNDRFKLGMVKFYVDGALGSRGAALLAPYSDEPGQSGLLILGADSLRVGLTRAVNAGFQCAVHAIGDRANRVVLDVWTELGHHAIREVPPFPLSGIGARPATLPAWRLEHAQIMHPDDLGRLGALGAVASMQPTHCTSDMPWAPDRLGPDRLRGAYAWRTLVDRGAVLAAGSDFPVESHRPALGLYAAVTRRPLEGGPPEGWSPEERLSRDEALVSMTAAAAYASGDLHRLGTLTEGKAADFVVMDRNLVTCDPEAIPEARALLTVVGGEWLWRHPDAPFAATLAESAR